MDERTGHWFMVAGARELGAKPLAKVRFGERLVFFRDASGLPACLLDQCPHRGAQLSLGQVEHGQITCPFHGFRFDENGRCTLTPCEGERAIPSALRAATYPVREHEGFIWLYRGHLADSLPALPSFPALKGTHFGEIKSEWSAHFTRTLEAQIDYSHLPFVHRTTIGRHVPKALPITTRVDGDVVRAWRGEEHDPSAQSVALYYPNVWVNQITPKLFIVVGAAPISEDRTEVYVRFQHRMVTMPGLRQIVSFIGSRFSSLIVRQDMPVVVSQLPRDANDARGDKLVGSDGPVAEFRRMRRAHLERGRSTRLRVLPS